MFVAFGRHLPPSIAGGESQAKELFDARLTHCEPIIFYRGNLMLGNNRWAFTKYGRINAAHMVANLPAFPFLSLSLPVPYLISITVSSLVLFLLPTQTKLSSLLSH